MTVSICGIIPVYNNHQTIAAVVMGLLSHVEYVIIVDDGSDDGTETILNQLAVGENRVSVLHMPKNMGKGAAVQRGLKFANARGFAYAVQVDGDGQHNLDDVPSFITEINKNEGGLVLGLPIFDDDIPFIRKHGRKLTNYMMVLEMCTLQTPDGNCGFRAYPVRGICKLGKMGTRMDWDPEVLVRASWAGIQIVQVPTKVRYLSAAEGGISHFRMVRDNVLHTWLHIRLLLQSPFRLFAKYSKRLLK
ncbi:MAG: glycosyltransferase family 2 protein [Mariprofundales bacterium]